MSTHNFNTTTKRTPTFFVHTDEITLSFTMHPALTKSLRRVRHVFEPSYHSAWPLHRGDVARPKLNPQRACPLFKELSAELRLIIYHAVLAKPDRFLHIRTGQHCRPRWKKRRRIAHYWCIDKDSPFPTWQHLCYDDGEGANSRPPHIADTDDNLLSLLLSCRLM